MQKCCDLYPDMLHGMNVQRHYKTSLDKQLRGSLNDRLMAEMSLQHPLCSNEIFCEDLMAETCQSATSLLLTSSLCNDTLGTLRDWQYYDSIKISLTRCWHETFAPTAQSQNLLKLLLNLFWLCNRSTVELSQNSKLFIIILTKIALLKLCA